MHNAIAKQFWTWRLRVNHGRVTNIKRLRIVLLIIWQIATCERAPWADRRPPLWPNCLPTTGIPRPPGCPVPEWAGRQRPGGVASRPAVRRGRPRHRAAFTSRPMDNGRRPERPDESGNTGGSSATRRVDQFGRPVREDPVRPQQPQGQRGRPSRGQQHPGAEQHRQQHDLQPVERPDRAERPDRPRAADQVQVTTTGPGPTPPPGCRPAVAGWSARTPAGPATATGRPRGQAGTCCGP